MNEYRIKVTIEPNLDGRSVNCCYKCYDFNEACVLAAVFDSYPNTIAIRVEEIMHIDVNLNGCFRYLNNIEKERVK